MKNCHFCTNNSSVIDYKDPDLLKRFLDTYGRISSRRRSGLCASHQRALAVAVKRARFLALLPFTTQ